MSEELEIISQQPGAIVLAPVMNLAIAKQRLHEFQEFVQFYLNEGEDYGTIPNTPKPTLYKPGADKLCELYGLSDSYTIIAKVEDFDRGLFDYTIECILTHRATNQFVSSGLGCCSSWESKYRWRNATRKCPVCLKEAIIKGKEEYGGGWVCFKKKDGCGTKFLDNDPAINGQEVGRVENPDIIDQKNTVLKMAKKRAKIDCTLSATRSSGIFTQDMEDRPLEVESEPVQNVPSMTLAGIIEGEGEKGNWFLYKIHTLSDEGEVDVLVRSAKASDTGRLAEKKGWLVSLKVREVASVTSLRQFELLDVLSVRKPEPDTQPAKKPADAPQSTPAPAVAATGVKRITAGQVKRLWAIAREKKLPEAAVKGIYGSHGFEHVEEITAKAYDTVIGEIEQAGALLAEQVKLEPGRQLEVDESDLPF